MAAQRGATAIEFSIIAMPFLFMIFAVLEIALIFLMSVTLEAALNTASRQIRTGQNTTVDGISDTASVNNFRKTICSYMAWQSTSCTTGVNNASSSSSTTDSLVVDVRDPASFGAVSQTSGTNSSNQLVQFDGSKSFCSGAAGSVVVVRAFYPWRILTPLLTSYFIKDANGNVVLQAAAVFKSEPFGGTNTC